MVEMLLRTPDRADLLETIRIELPPKTYQMLLDELEKYCDDELSYSDHVAPQGILDTLQNFGIIIL